MFIYAVTENLNQTYWKIQQTPLAHTFIDILFYLSLLMTVKYAVCQNHTNAGTCMKLLSAFERQDFP